MDLAPVCRPAVLRPLALHRINSPSASGSIRVGIIVCGRLVPWLTLSCKWRIRGPMNRKPVSRMAVETSYLVAVPCHMGLNGDVEIGVVFDMRIVLKQVWRSRSVQ